MEIRRVDFGMILSNNERRKKLSKFVLLILALTLASCTMVPKPTASQTQEILVAAGFEAKEADTPEKVAKLKAMPQKKFIRHSRDGKTYYLYADTTYCNCIYKGDEANFARYRELVRERQKDYAPDLYEQQGQDFGERPGWDPGIGSDVWP